jgi:hypothetical protein
MVTDNRNPMFDFPDVAVGVWGEVVIGAKVPRGGGVAGCVSGGVNVPGGVRGGVAVGVWGEVVIGAKVPRGGGVVV